MVSDLADDHRSVSSADGRNARSPLSVSEVGVVTPAQAYASAVKTGKTHDRALYYTIERRQPERKGRADSQFVPSHLGDPGSPERGLSFAQRLYASALSDKSSTLPSSNVPVLPPIKHASSSALPISGGGQVSCGVPRRKTSPSTSLFDTSSDVSQSFNPSDLYHSSVATHGLPSRGSTGVSAICPPSLLPVLQSPNFLPVAPLLYPVNPFTSYSSSPNFTSQSGVQNPCPVLRHSQTVPIEPQSHSTSVPSIHGASCLRRVSGETHQNFHPLAATGGAKPSPPPLGQQLVIPPSSSPPSFEEHKRLSNLSGEVVADAMPVVIQSPAVVSHRDGLLDSSLQPPIEIDHEDVPLYSLVDEQHPPPAFDDVQVTSAGEASAVVLPETLSQEVIEAPSSQLPSPSQSPSPFSHGSTAYTPGKALAYALPDPTSYSVGTKKDILQDAQVPFSSTTIWHASDSSSSDPPGVGFKWSNQLASTSPISPSSAVSHDGLSMTPLLPPHSRPVSVLSSHSLDNQSTRTSCVPLSIRKSTTSSLPLVNYHTKPIVKQSGQPFLPPLALQSNSGSRSPEGSNTIGQARRDFRPFVNAAEDNDAIDSLTHSMSDMMEGQSSDMHSLAYENLSSGRPHILGTTLGNQQNIPTTPASHPSGVPNTIGSLSQERHEPKAERLIQEAYRRPTHAETGGRAVDGIQGLGLANPQVTTNILSSQHLPRTIPSPGPLPPPRSHDGLQTVPFCPAGDELTFSQFGETVALSASRSAYSDRPHVASVLPSRLFPAPLQPSHHSIDRDVRGSVVPSGSVLPQQQKTNSLENLDFIKCGGRGLPPPPISLRPTNVPRMPQTSSYSQDNTGDQFGSGHKAPVLSSNDLARKFAHDALMAPSSAPAHAFYRSSQH